MKTENKYVIKRPAGFWVRCADQVKGFYFRDIYTGGGDGGC